MRTPGSELECLSYIDKCIESLHSSLATTTAAKAIESIKLQMDHHMRQRELLQFHVDKFRRVEHKQSSAELQSVEKIFTAYKGQNDLFENLKLTEEALDELKSSHPDDSSKLLELNSQLHQIVAKLVAQVDETVAERHVEGKD